MSWTQSDLDALDKVIKSGTLKVNYPSGGSVEYRTMSDLIQARTMISDELAAASGTPRSLSTLTQFRSGN